MPMVNGKKYAYTKKGKAAAAKAKAKMKKKKTKKLQTKKTEPNSYGLGKFNYMIFKFLCSRFKLK